MANNKIPASLVYGLDIGTRNIVGTVGYREGKKFVVLAIESLEHETRAMLDGQIHDISVVAESVAKITKRLEEKIGSKLTKVCIAAAGRVLKTTRVHTDFELPEEKIVDEEDIYTLNSLATEDAYKKFLEGTKEDTRFYCVGSSVVKYYLNDLAINNLLDHKAQKIGVDLIATFLPDDVVDSLYRTVNKAGLEVASLTLEPIAAIGLAIPEKFRLLNIALVDVGAGTSDVSITSEGSVVAFGMIPEAGDRITEKIAQYCMTDFNTAEFIKKECNVKDKVEYMDIMGMTLTVKSSEIKAQVKGVVDELADLAAKKIIELNGDKTVGAVFVVGGGGVYEGYTTLLAKKLSLNPLRVALRGQEVMSDIVFKDEVEISSLLVTPIGIALSYYEEANNFIYVDFNGNKIKVYNSNTLSVMDVAMQTDFPAENFFPKAGDSIKYKLNGMDKIARGSLGEPAAITVNGVEANMNSFVKADDIIVVKDSTKGEPAALLVSNLPGYKQKIKVIVNDKTMELPKYVMVNGNLESGYYLIKEGDNVSIPDYYTLDQVKLFLDVNPNEEYRCTVNNAVAFGDEKVYENFTVSILPGSTTYSDLPDDDNSEVDNASTGKEVDEKNSKAHENRITKEIFVTVNSQPVKLSGKRDYVFVDIFESYEFDLTKSKGEIKTIVNGKDAEHMQPIYDGDIIEVYWKN